MQETISRKAFETGNFPRKHDNVDEHPVTVFLQKNKNSAFTVKAITKKVNMKEDTIRSMLGKLEKQKKVQHTIPYYIWKK